MRPFVPLMVALVLNTAITGASHAGGVTKCATEADSSLGASGAQPALFQPHRLGQYGVDLTARDFELLWDVLYGGLDANARTTLNNFVMTLVGSPGHVPTMTDAVNLQAVYDQLRREASDWNAVNPRDSTALRVGRSSGVENIGTYPNVERAHSDVYIFHPTRPVDFDGSWPSEFISDNEDISTGHPLGEVFRLNAVTVKGPTSDQAIDLTGTGWTAPTGIHRIRVNHELQHSMPPGESGVPSELWSAAAEAVGGIRDTTAVDEVPYTWPLLSRPGGPSCTFLRTASSNYQARTSFMAYLAYNFLNADTNRTRAGMADDLLTMWAKLPQRNLNNLVALLSDGNCATCASKAYFHPLGPSLSNRQRLNVLLHNWRVANFVNKSSLAEGQYGYPAWSGFSPATQQNAWQDFDNCGTDDIVALPATVTLGAQQITRDLVLSGERSFRGATFPLSIAPFAAQYWVIRAGEGLTTANRDLVIRVSPRTCYDCRAGARRDASILASAVAYSIGDSGEESSLWRLPEYATLSTPVGMADVDSVAGPIELVIPDFGVTHRSALLVITVGDGRSSALAASTDHDYSEAVPYRLEIGTRAAPYLTTNPSPVSTIPTYAEGMPSWAPASDEVAYFALDPPVAPKAQIFRKRLDGSAPVRVAAQSISQFAPDWSPRGDAIAYEGADTDSTSSIWVTDLGPSGTGTPRQITSLPGCASMPAFQPNGQGLAYTYLPPGSPTCYLRWVALDGTGDMQLASLGDAASFWRRPRWSFDGDRIFISLADQADKIFWIPRFGGAPVADNTIRMPAKNLDFHPGTGRVLLETNAPLKNNALENPVNVGCFTFFGTPEFINATRVCLLDTTTASRDTSYRIADRTLVPEYPLYSPDGTRVAYQLRDPRNLDVDVYARQVSWNHAPAFGSTMGDKGLSACVPFQMALLSSDPDGELPTYKASYLPSGSQIINGNTFRWQHPSVGTYFVVFRAMDGSGGVDSRVIRINVVDDGNCGDPYVEGDGGCGACLRSGPSSLGSQALPAEGTSTERPANSYLNGVMADTWVTQTARLGRLGFDSDGNVTASLRANLPGVTTIDKALVHVVDHPRDTHSLSTSDGVVVGRLVALDRVEDEAGRDVLALMSSANRLGEPLELSAGTTLLATWRTSVPTFGLALETSLGGVPGWGVEIGLDVQVPDGPDWRTVDRVRPRRGFDLQGCLTPGAKQVRLVLRSDTRIRGISGLFTSPDLDAESVRRTLAIVTSGHDVQSIAEADARAVSLGQGEIITLGIPPLEPSGELIRSYFLEMRASYAPATGVRSQQLHATDEDLPAEFGLSQTQPNPSRGEATFRFDLPRASHVRIDVFDPQGRRVRTLIDEHLGPGSQTLRWDGMDEGGNNTAPGVYLYRMTAGSFRAEKRMVRLAR